MTELKESHRGDSEVEKDADELNSDHSVSSDESSDSFYSETNLEHLRKAIKEMEAGKFVVHPLIEDRK